MGPDQRFLGILDTSPFRIAIVYSLVFACGAALLLGVVDFAVSRVVDRSTDNLIDVHMSRLRQAVDKGFAQPLIHTVRGAGYVIRDEDKSA